MGQPRRTAARGPFPPGIPDTSLGFFKIGSGEGRFRTRLCFASRTNTLVRSGENGSIERKPHVEMRIWVGVSLAQERKCPAGSQSAFFSPRPAGKCCATRRMSEPTGSPAQFPDPHCQYITTEGQPPPELVSGRLVPRPGRGDTARVRADVRHHRDEGDSGPIDQIWNSGGRTCPKRIFDHIRSCR
jgi:hypothetical protein